MKNLQHFEHDVKNIKMFKNIKVFIVEARKRCRTCLLNSASYRLWQCVVFWRFVLI